MFLSQQLPQEATAGTLLTVPWSHCDSAAVGTQISGNFPPGFVPPKELPEVTLQSLSRARLLDSSAVQTCWQELKASTYHVNSPHKTLLSSIGNLFFNSSGVKSMWYNQVVVVHAFNPSISGAETGRSLLV